MKSKWFERGAFIIKHNNLKAIKHQLQQQKWKDQKIAIRKKQKPIKKLIDFYDKYAYIPDATTARINHHYQDYVGDIINNIQTHPYFYNSKDTRMLLPQLDYADVGIAPDIHMYYGVAIDSKVVIDDNGRSRVYILVADVHALVNGRGKKKEYKRCTDHIWLNVNNHLGYFQPNEIKNDITIGLGDAVYFCAKVQKYRGVRRKVKQTKYTLNHVIIMKSGYPKLKISPNKHYVRVLKGQVINYQHHQNFLLRLYNPFLYPMTFPEFGNQFKVDLKPYLEDSYYHFSLDPNSASNSRDILQPNFNDDQIHDLVYRQLKTNESILWINHLDFKPTTDTLIGTSQELKTLGFEKFYQQLCQRYHWRWVKKDSTPNPKM